MRQLEEACDCQDDSELCDQVFSVRQEQRISLLVVSGRLLCKFLGYHMVVGVVTHDQTNRHSLLISRPCIQYSAVPRYARRRVIAVSQHAYRKPGKAVNHAYYRDNVIFGYYI